GRSALSAWKTSPPSRHPEGPERPEGPKCTCCKIKLRQQPPKPEALETQEVGEVVVEGAGVEQPEPPEPREVAADAAPLPLQHAVGEDKERLPRAHHLEITPALEPLVGGEGHPEI